MSSSSAKDAASQKLLVGEQGPRRDLPASQRIPVMVRPWVSDKAKKMLDVVEKFVEEECIPADPIFSAQVGQGTVERFNSHPAVMEDLKKKAQALGLWNMFLPLNHFKDISPGFTNLEYGLMAEYLGKSGTASEVCTPRASGVQANQQSDAYGGRPATALLPTLAIWRSLHDMALPSRRRGGSSPCSTARSALPSS